MDNAKHKPLLELRDIRRSFSLGAESTEILHGINLDIFAGEMVAIIGQSGSGKSTLMNILGCLDQPTSGEYRINGQQVAGLSGDELAHLRREYFGFIFQRYHLLGHLDAVGNAEIPAIYSGVKRARREERAHQLLARLGLGDRITHRPGELSGGQQQRVSIARALMNGGQVILADEPTGALDTKSGREVLGILKELHEAGHTVIIVTHDPGIAAHAGRIIEIRDGEVISDKTNDAVGDACYPFTPVHLTGTTPSLWRTIRGATDRFREAFRMACLAMVSHKLRTILTMLGIIIGIMAVVSVVALGQGASQKVVNDISSIGTNTISIYPGKTFGDMRSGKIQTLTVSDMEALEHQMFTDAVTPDRQSQFVGLYGDKSANVRVHGVSDLYFRVKGQNVETGREFDRGEVKALAQVVVIDQNTKDTFFQGVDPIGKFIILGKVPCQVVGVLEASDSPFENQDALQVYIPYTSMMHRVVNENYLGSITLRVKDGISNAVALESVEKLLLNRHGTKDFFTSSSDAILKTITKTTDTFTYLISAIAVISLVVGGIGVMNIMLVSVTERTREIGIRMAVGARQSDILQQFLIEAVLVCLIGGGLGVLCSYGISFIFGMFVQAIAMEFSVSSIVAAVLCSSLIGVIFGYLPARSAARLNPIDALARE
ncbi:MAG: MacB family efflux pump subunit [Succinivibrionaceae bacterium]|nr:MacB family efflux pump subunit [Succinivibrionaceae bacterium]